MTKSSRILAAEAFKTSSRGERKRQTTEKGKKYNTQMSYQTAVLHHVPQSIVDRLLDLKVRIQRGRMRKEEANSIPWPLIKQGLSGKEIKSVFGNHRHSYCTVKTTLHKILEHSFKFSDLILLF